MERKIFEESGVHISDCQEKSGQWLGTGTGARFVSSIGFPANREFYVALDQKGRGYLGVRPVRSFF